MRGISPGPLRLFGSSPGLLEQVLQVAFFLLQGTPPLVRTPLGLLYAVPAQGPGRLFEAALGLVHCPFALVVAGGFALSANKAPSRYVLFVFLLLMEPDKHRGR